MCGWQNVKTGEVKSFYPDFNPANYQGYAFSGIHVISPRIFDFMDEWTGRFSIIDFYVSVCAKADIQAYVDDNQHLIDIGKPETLQQAEAWLRSKSAE
jgi:NDP-sugar pyrophosphorylase family protein